MIVILMELNINAGRASRCLVLTVVTVVLCLPLICSAQGPWSPGQNISWQSVRSPSTPGDGAIVGGPGAAPAPGSPLYICRAMYRGAMVPGKWVKGNCNIPYGGREIVMTQYQVAYGNAYWRGYDGAYDGLAQTGYDRNGNPLYSCRVHYFSGSTGPSFPNANPPGNDFPNMPAPPDMNPPSMPLPDVPAMPNMPNLHFANIHLERVRFGNDLGFQPGKIVNGNCNFPLGGREIVQPPPFQALYAGGGYVPPYYPPYPPQPRQPPADVPVGPSSVTWQSEQAPFTPGAGAIIGGPGYGPEADAPLYICRAGAGGGLYPGKWIQGQCSISYGGREYKENTYDVAFGSANWGSYGGLTSDLIQGGFDSAQNPIYVCRVPHFNFWFKDRGSQPGKLVNGQCLVSYGGSEIPSAPPFQALYSTVNASVAPVAQTPSAATPQTAGIQVVVQSGTAAEPGKVTIMNGASGVTVAEPLNANQDQAACVAALQKAALDAGLQIQGIPGGLKIFGANNAVSVSGASVAVSQF